MTSDVLESRRDGLCDACLRMVTRMEEERITLRMGTDIVQMMDAYLLEHPELGKQSNLIRVAIREYLKRDAKSTPSYSDNEESGLFVRFTPEEIEHMKGIAAREVFIRDVEELIRTCMRDACKAKQPVPFEVSSAETQMSQKVDL